MTLKSIVWGMLGATAICAISYYNDYVLRQALLLGSHLPVGVFGPLIVFLLIANPLLYAIRQRWALSGKDLAVVLVLTLTVCAIPTNNLMRNFTPTLMMPHHSIKREVGWSEHRLIDLVPPVMLADPGPNESALTGYIQGLSREGQSISIVDIPWQAWWRTLLFWLPTILSLWIALIGFSLLFHKQWSEHEILPYPIAELADSLLPKEDGVAIALFRNRAFLGAALFIFLIHFNNHLYRHLQDWIEIKLRYNFAPLLAWLPSEFYVNSDLPRVINFRIYFTAIGIAFLLARDVSFTLGVGPMLYGIIGGVFGLYGVSLTAGGYWRSSSAYILFGGYFGLCLAVFFLGRRYYFEAIRQSLGFKPKDAVEGHSILGVRLIISGLLCCFILLNWAGLEWPFAVAYIAIAVTIYIGMSRILAETGLFANMPLISPEGICLGLLGMQFVGPQATIIMGLLTSVFLLNPHEAFMPFISNNLRMLELRRVAIAPMVKWSILTLVVGMIIALAACMYWQYSGGNLNVHPTSLNQAPRMPFQLGLKVKQALDAQGIVYSGEIASSWQRFDRIAFQPGPTAAVGFGVAGVLCFTAIRWRFPKWPLHPVMFVTWIGVMPRNFAVSFLIGWGIKSIVSLVGGEPMCARLKPAFLGLVVGALVAGMFILTSNFIHYLISGDVVSRGAYWW